MTAHNAEVKKKKITDFFPGLLCVSAMFSETKTPAVGESCGKGVRPEDVSALASDNVSWRDTACHFTEPHIKKDRGGREDSMSFVCFDTRSREGLEGRLHKCVCVSLRDVCVCMSSTWWDEGLGYFLDVFYKITLKQTGSSVMSGFLLRVP